MAAEESTAAGPGGGGGAKGEAERVELDKRGQALARRAAESKATIPHLYLRRSVKVDGPELHDATIVRCLGQALAEHGRLNCAYRDGALELHSRVNVALAAPAGSGPQYPVLMDAGQRTEAELAAEIINLRERAASESLAAPELAGATVTLTIIAAVDELLPVVTPGQAAHLAVGRTRTAAIVLDGEVSSGHVATLALAVDHRAAQAEQAGAFLEALAQLLEGAE